MKENLKKRLDRVEEVTMPAKGRSIHEYSDEELEEIIRKGTGETGELTEDKLLVIMRNARNHNE